MSTRKQMTENKANEIRRHVRKTYSAEEKLRIVMLGLKGDANISELCQKEGINVNLYQVWSKEFIEGGKSRLSGEYSKDDSKGEIQLLRNENKELKLLVAELVLENRGLHNGSE